MMAKVTNLAAWRAAHTRPVNDVLQWHALCEQLIVSQIRIIAAWQRTLWRW